MKPPRDEKGRFIKGYHYSPETEFKKGQHWRSPKPFWQKEWLENEYINKKRSASEIAKQFNTTENNIFYWLEKHKIPRRKMTEIRKIKYWGVKGKDNPMYGVKGEKHPSWRGGITPLRIKLTWKKPEWKDLIKKIKEETNYICEWCNKNKAEEIHHILPLGSFPELSTEKRNLLSVCKECHKEITKKLTRKTYRINTPEDLKEILLKTT